MTTVAELMIPYEDYTRVSLNDSLLDAIQKLAHALTDPSKDPARPRDRGVLVCEPDGTVVGKVSMWRLLQGLEPSFEPPIDPYGVVSDTVLFFKWLDAGLTDRARSVKIADLMGDKSRFGTIDEKAPLDLAVHRLIRSRVLSLLVMRGGAVAGILRLSDVFLAISKMLAAKQHQPSSA